MSERDWINGHRAAWSNLLGQALLELGVTAPDAGRLALQLEQARAALRRVCEDHGDNDWDDDLNLADVIEKHLGRHLDERGEER